MTILQAIVLGIVQGITEFLPISSSGHLIVIPQLFGWGDQGLTFDVLIHVATLAAVVVYFRARLLTLCREAIAEKGLGTSRRFIAILLLSVIPAGVIGVAFGDQIESQLRMLHVVATGLIFWGGVLLIADKRAVKVKTSLNHVSWKQVFAISMAQAIALIPGTSRSGITMTAGLFGKLDRQSAAEFSFLMSIPVIGAAGLLRLKSLLVEGAASVSIAPLVAGFLGAFVAGFFAIAFLMNLVQKKGFAPFAYYRIALGLLLLLLF